MKTLFTILILLSNIAFAADVKIIDEVDNQSMADAAEKFALQTEVAIKLTNSEDVSVSNWAANLKLKRGEKLSNVLRQATAEYYTKKGIRSTKVKALPSYELNIYHAVREAAGNLPEGAWDKDLEETYADIASDLSKMAGKSLRYQFYLLNSESADGFVSELAVFDKLSREIKVFGTLEGLNPYNNQ